MCLSWLMQSAGVYLLISMLLLAIFHFFVSFGGFCYKEKIMHYLQKHFLRLKAKHIPLCRQNLYYDVLGHLCASPAR